MAESIRVLIVEDLPTDAELNEREVRKALSNSVFMCVETRKDYLDAIHSFIPDVILSDYKLPQFDGMTALKLAQEHSPDVPFILVTGSMNEDTAVECIKAGAWDYVIKEHIKRLGPAVIDALEQRKLLLGKRSAEEKSRRWEKVFEKAQFGLAYARITDDTFIEVNATFARERGFTPDELKDRLVSDIYAPGEDSIMRRLLIKGGEKDHVVFESVHRRKDGSCFPVLMEVTLIKDDLNKPISWVAYALDISEQKAAQEELRKSYDFYLTLFEEFPALIWRSDVDGSCNYFNNTWLAFTGRPLEEELGEDWLASVHPDDIEAYKRLHQSSVAARQSFETVYRLRRADGEYRWVQNYGRPFFDLQGAFAGFIGSCYDITNHKKAEDQLRHTTKLEAIGQLAGGVAHDFNNILTGLLGMASFAYEKIPEDSTARADLSEVIKLGERAANLTRQLLAFSRQQQLSMAAVDINERITEMLRMVRRLISEDIVLEFIPNTEIRQVMFDPGQLEQVILNLALNARDAMPHGGRLIIKTSKLMIDGIAAAPFAGMDVGEYVEISVTDTGTGISPEIQARIFEPFFTTKEVGKGTGLGLSTAYGIIKQHGGYLTLSSEIGKGTRFRIFIPCLKTNVATTNAPDGPSYRPEGGSVVLLVEDEESVRRLIARLLEGWGYKVLAASNPGQAEALFAANYLEIELLLSDVIMPGGTGPELYQKLRERRPTLRALFISGYNDNAAMTKDKLAPNAAFLQKPFRNSELANAICSLIQ